MHKADSVIYRTMHMSFECADVANRNEIHPIVSFVVLKLLRRKQVSRSLFGKQHTNLCAKYSNIFNTKQYTHTGTARVIRPFHTFSETEMRVDGKIGHIPEIIINMPFPNVDKVLP